jgi:hypothetical protein
VEELGGVLGRIGSIYKGVNLIENRVWQRLEEFAPKFVHLHRSDSLKVF